MKSTLLIVMALLMLLSGMFVTPVEAKDVDVAGFTLPQPQTPDQFVYYPGEGDEGCDALTVIATVDKSVAKLAQEYWEASEEFCESRELASFQIAMQFDVSLDSPDDWQHTTQWDTKTDIGGNGTGYNHVRLDGSLTESVELFWLTYYAGEGTGTFEPLQPAIIGQQHTDGEYQWDTYYFDTENHSLYIRCRYIMVWYFNEGDKVTGPYSSFGPWSQNAVFGKGSTQVLPNAPETYAAPVISDLQLHPADADTEFACLTYVQETPKSAWDAETYYAMTGEGGFERLETQISIDGGDWQAITTDNSSGSQCLHNGLRTAMGNAQIQLKNTADIKLRVRFLGTDGPSEWSNELYLQKAEDPKDDTAGDNEKDACALCGICPAPLKVCAFLWAGIAVAVIAAAVVVVIVLKKRKK